MSVHGDKSSIYQESTPGKTCAERTREVQMEVASARRQSLEPIPEFFRLPRGMSRVNSPWTNSQPSFIGFGHLSNQSPRALA